MQTNWQVIVEKDGVQTRKGPFTLSALVQAAKDQKIHPKTMLIHPELKDGQPIAADRVRPIRDAFPIVIRSANTTLPAVKSVAPTIVSKTAQSVEEAWSRYCRDDQDPNIVAKLYERVSEICTSSESILYMAVQQRPVMNVAPDAVVITNKRFIVFRTKMLGRMNFVDCLWRDCGDVHLKEDLVGATLSFKTNSGVLHKVDYIPKKQARMIYRHAQQMEEEGHEALRLRRMEESRAAAGQVVVQHAQIPEQDRENSDDVATLKKLKVMLDEGLIEQSEYDAKKAEILGRM